MRSAGERVARIAALASELEFGADPDETLSLIVASLVGLADLTRAIENELWGMGGETDETCVAQAPRIVDAVLALLLRGDVA